MDRAVTHHKAATDLIGPYGMRILCLRADRWADVHVAEEVMCLKTGFDCVVVNRAEPPSDMQNALIAAIAIRAGDWVEVFGDRAEVIHDLIDLASVRIGRQSVVGDGNPMTTWHEEPRDSQIASYIWTGGQGESSRKVVVVVGLPKKTGALLTALVSRQNNS